MKRFCKSILTTIIVLAVTIIGLRLFTYNNTSSAAAIVDRFNPLVKTEVLYTKTTSKYDYKFPDAVSKIENFAYVRSCYTKNGKLRKLEYISFGKQLTSEKFLKITAKGQSVLDWEEVSEDQLPEKVLLLL